MKIDVTQVIRTFDGEPMIVDVQVTGERCESCGQRIIQAKELTLRLACNRALLYFQPSPPNPMMGIGGPQSKQMSGEDKWKRGELARKIHDNDTLDLTAEEIVDIKDALTVIWGPDVIYQTYNVLEQREAKNE